MGTQLVSLLDVYAVLGTQYDDGHISKADEPFLLFAMQELYVCMHSNKKNILENLQKYDVHVVFVTYCLGNIH